MALTGPHNCPCCGCFLTPKKAQGGKAPGHFYLHCHSCHDYHFTFPKHTTTGSEAVPLSSAPGSASKLARKKLAFCAHAGCARTAHSSCTNKMCKGHCVDTMGGCVAPAHNYS
ncbi:hypothetical protein L208DRAFT_1476562, partial [Tricholoma matsutake]